MRPHVPERTVEKGDRKTLSHTQLPVNWAVGDSQAPALDQTPHSSKQPRMSPSLHLRSPTQTGEFALRANDLSPKGEIYGQRPWAKTATVTDRAPASRSARAAS